MYTLRLCFYACTWRLLKSQTTLVPVQLQVLCSFCNAKQLVANALYCTLKRLTVHRHTVFLHRPAQRNSLHLWGKEKKNASTHHYPKKARCSWESSMWTTPAWSGESKIHPCLIPNMQPFRTACQIPLLPVKGGISATKMPRKKRKTLQRTYFSPI